MESRFLSVGESIRSPVTTGTTIPSCNSATRFEMCCWTRDNRRPASAEPRDSRLGTSISTVGSSTSGAMSIVAWSRTHRRRPPVIAVCPWPQRCTRLYRSGLASDPGGPSGFFRTTQGNRTTTATCFAASSGLSVTSSAFPRSAGTHSVTRSRPTGVTAEFRCPCCNICSGTRA